jgi:uncharacterized lipoprotein YmbA
MTRVALLVLLLLAVSGCAGSADTTRFYVLAPADSAAGAAPRPASEREVRIGIRSVELPRYLERPQIVTRASATRLEVAEFHQWGAPLRQTVPGILAENLSRLVPTDQVLVFPWGRAFAPDAQVLVDISRLEGALGGESVLAARWRVLNRAGEEVAMGTARFSEPSGPDYESLVAAQSRLVAALSRDIAAAVRSGVQASHR